jgi:tRNA(Ile)-lysidine synthase
MRHSPQPTVALVLERVRDSALIEPGVPLVVLVSGGRDSLCLLDALVTICGPGALEALHVNYGLRGEDSDADELRVRELCDGYGLRCSVRRAADSPPRKGNLQAWARELRYAEASRLAAITGARIATAHTASDQVETVLYRLASSPGRRALLGIAPRDGSLIRPLLACTREQTAAYCRERALEWREDVTNADRRFARARIRHDLLEELRAVHPAAEANILATAEILRAEAEALAAIVDGALGRRTSIPLRELARFDAAIAKLVLVRLAEDAAGRPVPSVAARLAEFIGLADRGGTTEIQLAGVSAIIEYGNLRFAKPTKPRAQPPKTALTVPGHATFGAWRLEASLHTDATAAGALARLRADGRVGVLDADALALDQLTVRGWQPGDRLRPIGLAGSKTLADLFTDRKLPRSARTEMPLLESAGEIVWIPGIATAERVAVGPLTTRVAVLSASRD